MEQLPSEIVCSVLHKIKEQNSCIDHDSLAQWKMGVTSSQTHLSEARPLLEPRGKLDHGVSIRIRGTKVPKGREVWQIRKTQFLPLLGRI